MKLITLKHSSQKAVNFIEWFGKAFNNIDAFQVIK